MTELTSNNAVTEAGGGEPPAPKTPRRYPSMRLLVRLLVVLVLIAAGVHVALHPPIQGIAPGEKGIRINRLTGGMAILPEGPALCLPGIHTLRRLSLRNEIYRSERSAKACAEAAFKSVEGLSLGAEVTVQYALDPTKIAAVAATLPDNVKADVIAPSVDGIVHRTFARYTVKEIFSTKRAEIQATIEKDIGAALGSQGLLVHAVMLGSIDLPPEYRQGLEGVLTEELSSEKMIYTLELREKQIKETELESEARKVQSAKQAEAQADAEVIAAKGKEEAMKHVLPLKEKEIEQRRLEAEADQVHRLKQAETEAQARRIETAAEADSRKMLAEADAYRIEVTGKASSEQLARDSELIMKNPLLIQKTLADKLSDKIQVIVAPAPRDGFFAEGILRTSSAPPAAATPAAPDPQDSEGE